MSIDNLDVCTIDLSPEALIGYLDRHLGHADKLELKHLMYEPGSFKKLTIYIEAWYDRFRHGQAELIERMRTARLETRNDAERWVALEFLRLAREMRRGIVPVEAMVH